jgi:hypothetical protein
MKAKFIIALKTARHFSLTWARSIQSKPSPSIFKIYCNIIRSAAIGQSVGITIRYGMNDRGSNPVGGEEIFHIRPNRPLGQPSLLYNLYRVSSPV